MADISKYKIMELPNIRILEVINIMEELALTNKCTESNALNKWITLNEWRKAFSIPRTKWLKVKDYVWRRNYTL